MSGLKGEGSVIGRRLVDGSLPDVDAADSWDGVEVVPLDDGAATKAGLERCAAVIQAVGFKPRPLPELRVGGEVVSWCADTLTRAPSSELQLPSVRGSAARRLAGVYGVGIAFPADAGTVRTSPDERPVGFSFALACAERAVSNLARRGCSKL